MASGGVEQRKYDGKEVVVPGLLKKKTQCSHGGGRARAYRARVSQTASQLRFSRSACIIQVTESLRPIGLHCLQEKACCKACRQRENINITTEPDTIGPV